MDNNTEMVGGNLRWNITADSSQLDRALSIAEQRVANFIKYLDKADQATGGGLFDKLSQQGNKATSDLEGLSRAVKNMGWDSFGTGVANAVSALSGLSTQGSEATRSLSSLSAQARDAVDTISKLQNADIKLNIGTSGAGQALQSAKQEINQVAQEAPKAQSTLSALSSAVKNFGWSGFQVGAGLATGALTKLVSSGIQGTDFLETARTSMSGLTGSMEEGNKALSIAAQFWQNNPFDRFTTTRATQQLIQFGRTTNQVSSDLELLGKVSMSTNTPLDELSRYYARTAASGRAMTMDLEMMSDRGIPIYKALGEATGKNTEEIRKMASEGKISFEMFRKAMDNSINEEAMAEFENTLSRMRDKLSGSISILAGDLAGYKIVNNELVISNDGLEKSYTRLLKTIAVGADGKGGLRGEKMRDAMVKLGQALADVIQKITPVVDVLINKLAVAIDFVAEHSELLLPILGGALALFANLGAQLPVIGNVITGLKAPLANVTKLFIDLVKLKPGLAGLLGFLAIGFVTAYKNSEEFREAISKIVSSLVTIVSKLAQPFQMLADIFATFMASDVIVGLFTLVAQALSILAEAIASIPVEVFSTLVGALIGFKLVQAGPFYLVAAGIIAVVTAIQKLGGVEQVLKNIVDGFNNLLGFLGNLANEFMVSGYNLIAGLIDGIASAAQDAIDIVASMGNAMVETINNIFQIHSPSRVMYDKGKNIVLGLANGITDSKSATQKAMDSLASDILTTVDNVISKKKELGLLDYNKEYKTWKKVSQMFAKGSKQYEQAIQKMEAARWSINTEIIRLQKEYNSTLEQTTKNLASQYSLFSEVNDTAGKSMKSILNNLDKQVSKYQGYASALETIQDLNLDPKLLDELIAMGVDSSDELQSIANATADELQTLNDLWVQKQKHANKAAVIQTKDLKKDTLAQISELTKGIDRETITISESGTKLVANIADGITGTIPTLKDAYKQLGSYIKQANKELAKTSSKAGSVKPAGDSNSNNKKTKTPKTQSVTPKTVSDLIDLDGMKNAASDWASNTLPWVVGGAVVAGLAVKGLPKIIELLKNSKVFDGFGKSVGKLFNFGKNAGDVGKLAQESTNIANASKTVGNTVDVVSQTTSKASSVLDTVKQGAKAVIWIAGAVAAMGIALGVAWHFMKDIELLPMIGKMVLMATVVGAMGALAYTAQSFNVDWKGILAIVGIAFDVAAVGVALGIANYMIPDNLALLSGKLAIMGVTIAVMGGLAFIGGIAWAEIGAGLVVILGIAGDLAAVALAMGQINTNIPDDIGLMQDKLKLLYQAIAAMEVFTTLSGFLAKWASIGILTTIGIAGDIAAVAEALGKADRNIPNDFGNLSKKIDFIKEVIVKIRDSNIGGVIKSFGAKIDSGNMRKVADAYADIGGSLRRIDSVTINKDHTIANIGVIKECIEHLKTQSGFIKEYIDALKSSISNELLSNMEWIAWCYAQIAWHLNGIGHLNFNSNQLAYKIGTITSSMGGLMNSMASIKKANNNGASVDDVKTYVEQAKVIFEGFLAISKTLKKVEKEDVPSLASKVNEIVVALGNIAYIGDYVNRFDWKAYQENVQSAVNMINNVADPIINKIREISKGEDIPTLVDKKDQIVIALGNIAYIGDYAKRFKWADQEWAIGMASSIAIKLAYDLIPALNTLIKAVGNDVDYTTPIQKARDAAYQLSLVNTSENKSLADKETAVAGAVKIATQLKAMMGAVSKITADNDPLTTIKTAVKVYDELVTGVITTYNSRLKQFTAIGQAVGTAFRRGFKESTKEMKKDAIIVCDSLVAGLKSRKAQLTAVGKNAIVAFRKGVVSEDMLAGIQSTGRKIAGNLIMGIRSRINSPKASVRLSGQNAILGFISGAKGTAYAKGTGVYWVGYNVAKSFLAGLKKGGEEGSPWKTTFQSGVFAVQGLQEGIKDQSKAVINEAELLATSVAEAMNLGEVAITPTLSTIGGLSTPVSVDEMSYGGGRGTVINQTNNNYVDYDIDQVNRDLAWMVSQV